MIILFKFLSETMSAIGGEAARYGRLCIRLAHWGCANRPFYHIVVAKRSFPNRRYIDPMEQVGTYDPMANAYNEKLCALNLERIQHYLAGGIHVEPVVGQLLGLAGLLPNHPTTYQAAWRNRRALDDDAIRRNNVLLRNVGAESSAS